MRRRLRPPAAGNRLRAGAVACYLPSNRKLHAWGVVVGSLTASTEAAGVPPAAMTEALQALATAIDLERDVKGGDLFWVQSNKNTRSRVTQSAPAACCGPSCAPQPKELSPSIASVSANPAPSRSGWRRAIAPRRLRFACRSTGSSSPRASVCAPIRSTGRRRPLGRKKPSAPLHPEPAEAHQHVWQGQLGGGR